MFRFQWWNINCTRSKIHLAEWMDRTLCGRKVPLSNTIPTQNGPVCRTCRRVADLMGKNTDPALD